MSFLELPFGFLASPSYFCLVTSAIQAIHQSLGPECEEWNTPDGFFHAWYMRATEFSLKPISVPDA